MTDRSQPDPTPNVQQNESARRILELELAKVRREAEVARLEAREAELELIIRRMANGESINEAKASIANSGFAAKRHEDEATENRNTKADNGSTDVPAPMAAPNTAAKPVASESTPIVFANRPGPAVPDADLNRSTNGDAALPPSEPRLSQPFSSWDEIRKANGLTVSNGKEAIESQAVAPTPISTEPHAVSTRVDAADSSVAAPHFDTRSDSAAREREPDATQETSDELGTVTPSESIDVVTRRIDFPDRAQSHIINTSADDSQKPKKQIAISVPAEDQTQRVDLATNEIDFDPDENSEKDRESRRRSPAALLVSTVAHVGILLVLAACTLSAQIPKDQVALTASASEPTEEVMETFEFETSEPTPETSQPVESEVQYEISPIGEIAVAEISPDALPAPPTPNISQMLQPASMSKATLTKTSKSKSVTKFCGVEGGGNHFVYLVDSSGSMGAAFESARAELLRAIDGLKPDQKFYVVFFDAESDYMRLADPSTDEAKSVKATTENKQALRRWAMRISMDRGRAPYDPLKFALKLKPDVIFLLSDGEFPQGIEDLLKEKNHFDNLFGDEGLISIVHTIGYHSREGESRMKRIAAQNKGQYRHVPKP